MATLTIRTNDSQVTSVKVSDMGLVILAGGATTEETFTSSADKEILDLAAKSVDLRELCTDDAYGTDSSTLIIGNGSSDVDQIAVDSYLTRINQPRVQSWFGGWG